VHFSSHESQAELATGVPCGKLSANRIIDVDVLPERMKIALDLGLYRAVLASSPDPIG